jgi:hypothetical protein
MYIRVTLSTKSKLRNIISPHFMGRLIYFLFYLTFAFYGGPFRVIVLCCLQAGQQKCVGVQSCGQYYCFVYNLLRAYLTLLSVAQTI